MVALLTITGASAQDARALYNEGMELYRRGKTAEAVSTLLSVEAMVGENPRVSSLLVYCYRNQNDFVNARIQLDKYKRLNPNGSGDEHDELLAMEPGIDEGLQKAEQVFKRQEEKRRSEEAEQAIGATYRTAERNAVVAEQKAQQQKMQKMNQELSDLISATGSSDYQKSKDFYYNYPSSIYRDSALSMWQWKFLNAAQYLYDEDAITRLNEFKQTFTYSPYMPRASAMYAKKWNDCLIKYRNELKYVKEQRNRRIGKSVTRSTLYAGLMFGLIYAITSTSEDRLGYSVAGAVFGVILGAGDPNGRKVSRLNQDIRQYKQKIKYYSAPPQY